ncbi:hypothetical protein [Azospirillum halopraeferens]|uniref:hypothetical protein n=1 Tax=Azospirillum halopraeferens TaxID=34010 RepID=UPI00040FCA62|nr:hypothetical protein [Azospirillum halopraeferens]
MATPTTPADRRLPTDTEAAWLRRGLDQPGGKLPLFDDEGQRVRPRIVRACLDRGWAERWFANPLKPDWLVCRLTATGRDALFARSRVIAVDFRHPGAAAGDAG